MVAPPNPPANIAPIPNFNDSGTCTGSSGASTCTNPCVTSDLTWLAYDNSQGCTNYVLSAINNARMTISEPAIVLPSNWYQLSAAEQLFVILNLERTLDGYPPYLGLNSDLTSEAQSAAEADGDPSLAPNFAVGIDADGYEGIGGAWAGVYGLLTADYGWMYNDGWGGTGYTFNEDCTSADAPACWGPRDELLGSDPAFNPGVGLDCTTCEVGTGYAAINGAGSYVDLVELPAGTPPAMTFTWESELPFLGNSTTSTTTTTTIPTSTTTSTSTTTTIPTSTTTTTTIPTTTTTTIPTSTTTSTSTTTTIPSEALGSPLITAVHFNPTQLSLRWHVTSGLVSSLRGNVYTGGACTNQFSSRLFTYLKPGARTAHVSISRLKSGVATIRSFPDTTVFSLQLTANGAGGGHRFSRCIRLGRP